MSGWFLVCYVVRARPRCVGRWSLPGLPLGDTYAIPRCHFKLNTRRFMFYIHTIFMTNFKRPLLISDNVIWTDSFYVCSSCLFINTIEWPSTRGHCLVNGLITWPYGTHNRMYATVILVACHISGRTKLGTLYEGHSVFLILETLKWPNLRLPFLPAECITHSSCSV